MNENYYFIKLSVLGFRLTEEILRITLNATRSVEHNIQQFKTTY